MPLLSPHPRGVAGLPRAAPGALRAALGLSGAGSMPGTPLIAHRAPAVVEHRPDMGHPGPLERDMAPGGSVWCRLRRSALVEPPAFPLVQAVAFGLLHHAPDESAQALAHLWALHLLLTPVCALILEWLHPLSRHVCLMPRRLPPLSRNTNEESLEPLGEFLGGDLYEWVKGNELCIPLAEFAPHMVVVGSQATAKCAA